MAINAIPADVRGPGRNAPEKTSGTGMGIVQNTHAANAVLVARWRVFRKNHNAGKKARVIG
jgi:hypothetical protein